VKEYTGYISRLIKCDRIKKSEFLLADFVRGLLLKPIGTKHKKSCKCSVGLMIPRPISCLKYRPKNIWLMSNLDIAVSINLADVFFEHRPKKLYGR
jgi:hypothetical protein